MRTQLVYVVLLYVACCGVCSDADVEQNALWGGLLRSLIVSKVSRNSAPHWRATLLNVCELVNILNKEVQLSEQTGLIHLHDFFILPETQEKLNNLQSLCRVTQLMELFQTDLEYLDTDREDDNANLPKRKSPYILKRQLYPEKARRPYILKRSDY